MIPYMVCRLDLDIKEIQIFQLLYKKCDWKTQKVKYTTAQLVADADKCLGLTPYKVNSILKKFKEEGMIIELVKGSKGNPTLYKIAKHNELVEEKSKTKQKQNKIMCEEYQNQNIGYKPIVEVTQNESVKNTKNKPKLNQKPIKETKNKDNIYITKELFAVQKKVEGDTTQLNATVENVIAAYPKTIQSSKDEKASIKLIQQLLMEGYTEQDLIRFSENYYKDYKLTNKNDMYLANCSNFYEFKYKEYIGLNKQEHKIKDYNSNGIFTL